MCRYLDKCFICEIVFPRANAPVSPMQLLSIQTSFKAIIYSQYAKPSAIKEKESYDNLQCDHISNENTFSQLSLLSAEPKAELPFLPKLFPLPITNSRCSSLFKNSIPSDKVITVLSFSTISWNTRDNSDNLQSLLRLIPNDNTPPTPILFDKSSLTDNLCRFTSRSIPVNIASAPSSPILLFSPISRFNSSSVFADSVMSYPRDYAPVVRRLFLLLLRLKHFKL